MNMNMHVFRRREGEKERRREGEKDGKGEKPQRLEVEHANTRTPEN
jgi:hypothetical protein